MILPLLLFLGLGVLAWPRSEGGADDELVLISPHWEGIQNEFTWAFEDHWQAKTGRSVRLAWLDLGGAGKCNQYVRSKGPGGSGADVFFGGGADRHTALAKDGFLAPVELPSGTLAAIPPSIGGYELRDGKSRWFAACLSSFGISYNRRVLERLRLPEPREWEDLADPRYLGWVGSGEPRSSGSVLMTYELILQTYGWEAGWAAITRMGGNVRSFTEGGNGIPRDVALGHFAAGGAIDFYAMEKVLRLGPENMGYSVPRQLPVINGDPVAVLAGAPHAELAAEFVRFVLSAEGQKVWFLPPGSAGGPRKFALGRLPVRPELYAQAPAETAAGNPFKLEGLGRYDADKAWRRGRALEQLLGAAVVDAQEDLRAGWRALVAAGLPPGETAAFGAPPCPEEEFLRLADDLWNSKKATASAQNRQVAEWGRWARAKYRAAAAACVRRAA